MTSTVHPAPRLADGVVVDVPNGSAGPDPVDCVVLRVGFCEPSSGTVVARIVGELDTGSAPRVWEVLHPWLVAPTRTVVVDVSALTFIDCDGLELLCACQRRAQEWLVSLRLVTGGTGRVDRLVDLLGLRGFFFRWDSVHEALT
jgi:anti-sigma B factor antagonist